MEQTACFCKSIKINQSHRPEEDILILTTSVNHASLIKWKNTSANYLNTVINK